MNFKVWLEVNEVVLPKLFEKVKQLKGEYSGIHFSKMDQLSFNLQPNHFDPIGIYVFPKKYVLEGNLAANTMFSSYPYAFLIEPTPAAKILNLDMNMQTAEELLTKMGIDKNLLYNKDVYHRSGLESPGHKFWGAIENFRNIPRQFKNLGRNISWNTLFSKTGYNALYDPGLRIIHPNEPAQVIYLDHKAYKIVDVVRNTNKHSLPLNFSSYFPDFKVYKIKSGWSKDEYVLRLKKNSIEITLRASKNNPNNLGIKVYGFGERYSSKEWYVQINSIEDMNKAVNDVKEFMSKSEVTPSYFKEQDYDVIKDISKYYKLKRDEEYPGYLGKKYKDNTKFELKYSPSENKITLQIEKRSGETWHSYFYYYETTPTNPEETIKELFNGIKERIKEDSDNPESRKKYDAPYALKFVEFLEKRVFIKRGNHDGPNANQKVT
jgi:hypothetical protein